MTDLPSILSGEFIGIFDPHEKFFGIRETGNQWHLDDPEITELEDQFRPYDNVFSGTGSIHQGYYDGTLFRFPLRKMVSELASAPCTDNNIRYLFDSFMVDGEIVLLFLKNLESVEIYERDRNSRRDKLIYHVKIADDCIEEVRDKRQEFINSMQNNPSQRIMMSYVVKIESCDYLLKSGNAVKQQSWLVNHYRPGRDDISRDLSDLSLTLHNLPWVSSAVPLNNDASKTGRVSCFLPLPPPSAEESPTGLPINVNAYFGVTDNRRDIKWLDAEQKNDLSARWNDGLLTEVLPISYVELLLDAITSNILSPDFIMSLLPDLHTVNSRWHMMAEIVYQNLFSHPVIYCDVAGGRWLELKSVVLDCDETVPGRIRTSVRNMLLNANYPYVRLPAPVLDAVQELCPFYDTIQKMTPALLRTAVRKFGQNITNYTRDEILSFLEYALSDGNYSDLNGLHLLPLNNGIFVQFRILRSQGSEVYIVSNEEFSGLFPSLDDIILDSSLPSFLLEELMQTEGMMRQSCITYILTYFLLLK